jgi:hypothetical protein
VSGKVHVGIITSAASCPRTTQNNLVTETDPSR